MERDYYMAKQKNFVHFVIMKITIDNLGIEGLKCLYMFLIV